MLISSALAPALLDAGLVPICPCCNSPLPGAADLNSDMKFFRVFIFFLILGVLPNVRMAQKFQIPFVQILLPQFCSPFPD